MTGIQKNLRFLVCSQKMKRQIPSPGELERKVKRLRIVDMKEICSRHAWPQKGKQAVLRARLVNHRVDIELGKIPKGERFDDLRGLYSSQAATGISLC